MTDISCQVAALSKCIPCTEKIQYSIHAMVGQEGKKQELTSCLYLVMFEVLYGKQQQQ